MQNAECRMQNVEFRIAECLIFLTLKTYFAVKLK